MPTGIYIRKLEHGKNISRANKGRKFSLEHRKKLGLAQIGNNKSAGKKWDEKRKFTFSLNQLGEKNHKWKGEKVSYRALHEWVQKHLGKPTECENCGKVVDDSRKIHWANKSHEYKRDLTDWMRLCIWCHKKYDFEYRQETQ